MNYRCTENFSALVLDQTAPTSRIEECVFWYKAELNLPPFKLANPIFHKLSARHAKSERERIREAEVRTISSKDNRITEVARTDRKGRIIREDREGSVIIEN